MLDRIMQNLITVTNMPSSTQPQAKKSVYNHESTKEYLPEFFMYDPPHVGKTM